VVLAELFTGSECNPCVAADKAFDFLTVAYDRSAVAVLEYHLHIPGPDPMTNADTEARSKYYSNEGTPTAVIGGIDKRLGGGPLAGVRTSYDAYTFSIDRRSGGTPAAEVRLDGSVSDATVTISVEATGAESAGSLRLRIALVEETVHYKGSNGWEEHRAVVRKMIGGADGIPMSGGKASYSGTVDVNALSASLKAYIEEVEREPRKLTFKEKRSEVNPANLALVAFVQDDESREVLQAARLSLKK
jgi:hypothetical protein